MRIGIDGLLLHGQYSGVEGSIRQLLRELSVDGGEHNYTIYVADDFGDDSLERPGLELSRMEFTGEQKIQRVLWTQTRFARRARNDGMQLLHGPGYILPGGWRGPSVVTVYDIIALSHPELCTLSNTFYYRTFLPRTIARASAVVVPAEAVKTEIVDRVGVPPEKIRVAPLGVGGEFTPNLPRGRVDEVAERHGIEGPYLLCVGNIEPKKNLAATIRAFGIARKQADLPHKLVLAGGKSWKSADVDAEISRLEPEAIHRTGYTPADDLPALYAGADTLLFWSLVEGFGLPALEAMASGTPVICSDRGALPEVVGDAARIVPIGPPEEFAEALVEVLGNKKVRRQLSRRGLARAKECTWRKHVDAVLRVYAEVGERGV